MSWKHSGRSPDRADGVTKVVKVLTEVAETLTEMLEVLREASVCPQPRFWWGL